MEEEPESLPKDGAKWLTQTVVLVWTMNGNTVQCGIKVPVAGPPGWACEGRL